MIDFMITIYCNLK